jgi:glycosyltransferase involved in cell wall biosynthesis
MQLPVYQINLSSALGGAEVYTRTFTAALVARGRDTRVITLAGARFWEGLPMPAGIRLSVADASEVPAQIPDGAVVIIHAPLAREVLAALLPRTRVVALAHQALYDDRWPVYYEMAHDRVPVSHHVAATLAARGFAPVWPEPLHAAIDLARGADADASQPLASGPLCDWDSHKPRDRIVRAALPWLSPLLGIVRPPARFERRPGLTLGVVSRLAPLKQFPRLFECLREPLRAHSQVSIEVFGSAVDYRALREFRRAVAPLGHQVRLWGHQADVARVYGSIDYLLTGLPEREALGLNVLEAQACGTPVLAPRSAPFTETVIDGSGGFLYTDPREDGGRDFATVLGRIVAGAQRPDPRAATGHLAHFGFEAFADRVDRLAVGLADRATGLVAPVDQAARRST